MISFQIHKLNHKHSMIAYFFIYILENNKLMLFNKICYFLYL